MKIRDKRPVGDVGAAKSNAASTSSSHAAGAAAYGANAELTPTAPARVVSDSTSIQGISETELTPAVRDALMKLMGEVTELRKELSSVRERLRDAEGLADTDALVPIYNRRAFVREVTRAMAAAKRYGSSLGLIYLDLNGLKPLNDMYGHAAGDAALRGVATLLMAEVRESDVVARLGGDEFGILLEHIDETGARQKAADIERRIRATPVAFEDQALSISASVGAVGLNLEEDPEQAFARADALMYAMKKARDGSSDQQLCLPQGATRR
ncbi:MAG: diguanylate cyclase (GGDEF)-like protein [Parvibaculaceae bacterium]|jgi:diguanylate cyclase (GGDEF)-like protein